MPAHQCKHKGLMFHEDLLAMLVKSSILRHQKCQDAYTVLLEPLPEGKRQCVHLARLGSTKTRVAKVLASAVPQELTLEPMALSQALNVYLYVDLELTHQLVLFLASTAHATLTQKHLPKMASRSVRLVHQKPSLMLPLLLHNRCVARNADLELTRTQGWNLAHLVRETSISLQLAAQVALNALQEITLMMRVLHQVRCAYLLLVQEFVRMVDYAWLANIRYSAIVLQALLDSSAKLMSTNALLGLVTMVAVAWTFLRDTDATVLKATVAYSAKMK